MKKRLPKSVVLLSLVLVLATVLWLVLNPRHAELRILFTADTQGRLEPCGCFEGQMGGLTRIDTLLGSLGRRGDLRLDVGDSIGGKQDFHQLHYDFMLKGFALLGFDALNIGAREAQLSAVQLAQLRKTSPVPMVSANVLDASTGAPIFPPYTVLRRAGRRIAIVGVMDPASSPDGFGEGVRVENMSACLSRLIPELKQKASVIVLLAFSGEQALSELARQFYEFDVILGGDVTQPSQELLLENQSIVLYVTNEARALGCLDVRVARDGRTTAIEHEIHLVHDLIYESARLRRLAATYRKVVRKSPLNLDNPEHLQIDRVPGVRQQAAYVGSDACKTCHAAAYKIWSQTAHAAAFSSLVARDADADPQCIGCHTVGFGQPEGYRRAYGNSRLVNVGCESCHGPGSLHISRGDAATDNDFRFRPLGAGDCKTCHHGEFSRPFHWEPAWDKIQHGQ